MSANRNKLSVAIDIATPEGQAQVRRLSGLADVFIENFKPGGLAKYGLAADALRALNPRLVYCSISGFGQTGPNASKPGYDLMAQGYGGMMSLTGRAGGPADEGRRGHRGRDVRDVCLRGSAGRAPPCRPDGRGPASRRRLGGQPDRLDDKRGRLDPADRPDPDPAGQRPSGHRPLRRLCDLRRPCDRRRRKRQPVRSVLRLPGFGAACDRSPVRHQSGPAREPGRVGRHPGAGAGEARDRRR